MRRLAALVLAAVLAAAACSTNDGASSDGDGDVAADAVAVAHEDPDALLCMRWTEYEALLESDAEPTDELIDEILRREREIDELLPDELEPAWNDVTAWTAAFVEYFAAAGYQEIDDEAITNVFGSEQSAEDAAAAMEAGFSTMREWSARNCTTGEGDAGAFCAGWPDISAVLDRLDEETPTEQLIDELFAAFTETAADVPLEIRDEWNALLAHAAPFRDVLVTVEYDLGRVSDELLAEAFGSVEDAAALEAAADRGRAGIDTWTLDGCGDFCSRWGETREAIEALGYDLGWVADMGEEGPARLSRMQARLAVATQQVPDELRAEWDRMLVVSDDWLRWWESLDFDGTRAFGPEGRAAAAAVARGVPYLPELLMEMEGHANIEDASADLGFRSDDELAGTWTGAAGHVAWTTIERIDGWVEQNCDRAGGQPGRVKVVWPEIDGAAGSMIVLAVMPAGATVDDLGDVDAREAGFCQGVASDPWGYEVDGDGRRHQWESDWLLSGAPEGWDRTTLCDFDWEAGPTLLDSGPYTLLVVMVPGGVSDRTLPAPTACTALDIVVDGDTTVPLPPLPACAAELPDLVVEPEPWQIPDRVDPATPGAGTLRVTLPSLILPEEIQGQHGGEVSIVVLQAGTTLNEIGREQVWPNGGFRTWLEPSSRPGIEGVGAIDLPVMEVPPTGVFGWFEPSWLAEASDDQLPLAVLAPGNYDVHADITGHSDRGEDRRCGHTTVTIDGPTVIDLPELGDCP